MFIDSVKVSVKAGKGGSGAVSFRQEKYVDRGGPNGGDGGKGGDVVFEASDSENTLLNLKYKPELTAQDGGAGSKQDRHGRNGEDLVIKVPVGTIVYRDGEMVADLTALGQRAIIARGGDGGFGNAHFKSSTRQAPKIAEKGEPGEEYLAKVELKLLADVGLIGFPNAGKSTFLSVVSNARPEIADYEFTTLSPNLGVAEIDDKTILIADIPGLIEGASEGKGLGIDFLRHVERTSVLLHLIDAYTDDIAKAYQVIRAELSKYSDELAERPEIVALTKIEGMDQELVEMQVELLKSVVPESTRIVAISSVAKKGLSELLRLLAREVNDVRQAEKDADELDQEVEAEIPVISLGKEAEEAWEVTAEGENIFKVTGKKIEKFARRTDFSNYHGVDRLRDIMRKLGITRELIRKGAKGDSLLRIEGAEEDFYLEEQE